jgi:hypothetical protein
VALHFFIDFYFLPAFLRLPLDTFLNSSKGKTLRPEKEEVRTNGKAKEGSNKARVKESKEERKKK